jgi:hypothetical protein
VFMKYTGRSLDDDVDPAELDSDGEADSAE